MQHGYYVEGDWFSMRFAQARGRARHLASEHKRDISIELASAAGMQVVAVCSPNGLITNVTPEGSDGAPAKYV